MITEKQEKKVIEDLAIFSSRALNRYSSSMYHYCPPNIVEKILLENMIQLRFTRSDCMNDSSEGNHALYLFNLAVKECFLEGQVSTKYRDFLYEVEQFALQAFKKNIQGDCFRSLYESFCLDYKYYLCCFSADVDSLPLWNYYVKDKKYEGYNIEMDSTKIEKAKYRNEMHEIWVSSVVYYKFFDQSVSLIKKYKGYFRNANELALAYLAYMFCCYLEKYRLVVKNHCFRHEVEVRAIIRKKITDKVEEQFDWSHGFPRPFITVEFKKEAFRSVMIGPLLEEQISRKNTEDFLKSRNYPFSNRVRNSNVPIRF